MTINALTPIFEEDDCCAVCGGTNEVGRWGQELPYIPVCEPCYKGGQFETWLAAEMEVALEESGEYEKLPDGKWKRKESK